MKEESLTPIKPYQKRLETVRKIGRLACVALIFVICGYTVYNVFRLIDAFDERITQPVENADTEEFALFPVVAFDPAGRWEIAGLSTEATANSPPLLQVPETATLLGVRNDRDGSPQMQLYEISEEAISTTHEKHWEQHLIDSWTTLGWTARSLEIPGVTSYECQKSGEYRFVQFFSDDKRYYLLLSRAGQD